MDFNDYVINQSDFDFYSDLNREEKLRFAYDLLCEEAYGVGSTDNPKMGKGEPPADYELADFDTICNDKSEQLRFLVNSTINLEEEINVLIVNKYVVMNAVNEEIIYDELFDMFFDGFVMVPVDVKPAAAKIFQHQDVMMVYEILGKENGYCEN